MRNLADRRKNIIKIMNVVVPLACSFCQCPVFRYRCKPQATRRTALETGLAYAGLFLYPESPLLSLSLDQNGFVRTTTTSL